VVEGERAQDELVGTKCMWKRGWAASQFWMISVLWAPL
jgi:hypothetical protein